MADLSRDDLLREEALIRAREVCCWGAAEPPSPEKIVQHAEAFYAFLNVK